MFIVTHTKSIISNNWNYSNVNLNELTKKIYQSKSKIAIVIEKGDLYRLSIKLYKSLKTFSYLMSLTWWHFMQNILFIHDNMNIKGLCGFDIFTKVTKCVCSWQEKKQFKHNHDTLTNQQILWNLCVKGFKRKHFLSVYFYWHANIENLQKTVNEGYHN